MNAVTIESLSVDFSGNGGDGALQFLLKALFQAGFQGIVILAAVFPL